jgi:hypothetical protein
VRLTLDIHFFGNGVYNVLSDDDWNLDFKIEKSTGVIWDVGNPPSQILDTVVIPEIIIL